MAENNDRRRILDMLAAGTISVDEATSLLKAIGSAPVGAGQSSSAEGTPRRQGAKLLRISIDTQRDGADEPAAKLRVKVPLSLAKFAGRFLPAEVSQELAEQGIDLRTLLDGLGDEVREGPLLDVEVATDENKANSTVHIVIEVI